MDSGGGNNAAFSDAVLRAQQVAAKLTAIAPGDGPGAGPMMGGGGTGNANMIPLGLKREFDEPGPPTKKIMTEADPLLAQMRGFPDSQQSDAANAAKAAAAQVAAKINQSLAASGGGGAAPMTAPTALMGLGMQSTEDYPIPDRMVGLVIGKGGEQISRLQSESGCKVQIAPDSGGMPDRPCTLTGSRESIAKAKMLMQDIIMKAKSANAPDIVPSGQHLVEMLIPGTKVGLIIGKGGETIRMLQESTGCKMVMIQDSSIPTDCEKPLRITGALAAAEEARKRVQELLDSKDAMPPSSQGGTFNDYGSKGLYSQEIVCPRTCVGIVIGKGGDVIKRIQNEYCVRVQFRPDDGGPERVCQITGSPDSVNKAVAHIQGLVEEANQNDLDGSRRRGGSAGSTSAPRGGPSQGMRGFGANSTCSMTVPADKCGLIIGKGGENIREIVNMSGAHVELQRTPNANPTEKVFEVRGSPENIQRAMAMIAEKAGIPPPPGPMGGGGPQGGGGGGGAPSGWNQPPAGGPAPWGQQAPMYGNQQPQQQPQQQQQPGWNQYGGYNQWGAPGNQSQAPSAPAAPAAPASGAPSQDPWAQYYQQYYQQQPAGAPAAQPATNGAQPPAAPSQPAHSAATSAATSQAGQPDYSQAWAQYYRSMGYHEQADAILAQGAGGSAPAQPSTSQ